MAKISARNCYKVAQIHSEHSLSYGEDGSGHTTQYRNLWVFRSDGAILACLTHIDGKVHRGGHSIRARASTSAMAKMRNSGGSGWNHAKVEDFLRYVVKRYRQVPTD